MARRSALTRAALIGGMALIILSGAYLGLSWAHRSRIVLVEGLPQGPAERAEFQKFADRLKEESGLKALALEADGSVSEKGKKLNFPLHWRKADLRFLTVNAGSPARLEAGDFRSIEGMISRMASYFPAPALKPHLGSGGTRYLIPARIDPWVFYASPSQLKAAGVKTPASLNELLVAIRPLMAAHQAPSFRGIARLPANPAAYSPMIIAGGSTNALLAWPFLIAANEDHLNVPPAGLDAKNGPLVEAINALGTLGKAGFFHPVSATSSLSEARDLLISGRATWSILPLSQVDSLPLASRGDIQAASLPLSLTGASGNGTLVAELDAWGIPAGAPNPKAAERALAAAWVSKELRFMAYASARLPGNTRSVARNEESQALRDEVNYAKSILLPPEGSLDLATKGDLREKMLNAMRGY